MAGEKIFFAWVDPTETEFDPVTMQRNDDDVFSITFAQDEGDFGSLVVQIKNPRIGLLTPGRKVWAWLSFFDGSDLFPMFFGRLLGIPSNVFDTLVTVTLTARPADFAARKEALAATMRTRPEWDDLFLSPDNWDDPDTVLEGRSVLWHIDPVTHQVTTSDVIVGEEGVVEFGDNEIWYDSLGMTLDQVPLRSITMQATLPWTQSDAGAIDISRRISQAFPETIGGGGAIIGSYTFEGLSSSWPQAGASMGSGWTVLTGSLDDISFLYARSVFVPVFFDQSKIPPLPEGSIQYPPRYTGKSWGGVDGAGFDINITQVYVPIGYGIPKMVVQYTAARDFAEIVTFTLNTAQQSVVTLPGEDETKVIKITANKVSDLGYDGTLPIVDVRRRSFLHTARGEEALQHLVCIARANLAIRSRVVKTTFSVPFKMAVQRGISLRKGGLIHDQRIPGGQAAGKIVSYSYSLDGGTGTPSCAVTIASAVGYGGALESAPGEPTMFEEGYITDDYQEFTNKITLLPTSDVTYTVPPFVEFDDKLDFIRGLNPQNAVKTAFVENGRNVQKAAVMGANGADQSAISAIMQNIPTRVHLRMVPMEGGPFIGNVNITVSDFIVPKQIDLEAASG